jgi:hypothetical protein
LPYRILTMRIRPKNLGPPLLRLGFGEFGGWPAKAVTNDYTVVFFAETSRKIVHMRRWIDVKLKSLLQKGFFVILNEVKDLNLLKIRDSSLRSE